MKECTVCHIIKENSAFALRRIVCRNCVRDRTPKKVKLPFVTKLIPPIEGELWMPVNGLEKYYRISSYGRLTSLCKSMRKVAYPRKKEKLLKPHRNSYTGYFAFVFSMWGNGKDKRYNIHKLVATHFIPNPNNLPEINHKNGVKTDNNVANLEWVTREDNIRHGFMNGLIKPLRGEKAHNSTLTNEQVLFIFNFKGSPRQLSRDLDMPYSKIASIRNGVSWNHITGAPKKYYGKEKNKERYLK
jgi:hypothetical protein